MKNPEAVLEAIAYLTLTIEQQRAVNEQLSERLKQAEADRDRAIQELAALQGDAGEDNELPEINREAALAAAEAEGIDVSDLLANVPDRSADLADMADKANGRVRGI